VKRSGTLGVPRIIPRACAAGGGQRDCPVLSISAARFAGYG